MKKYSYLAIIFICLFFCQIPLGMCIDLSLVSVSSDEVKGNLDSHSFSPPSLSSDGRFIVFASKANNLVADDTNNLLDVFLRDTLLGTTERISVNSAGVQGDGDSKKPIISANGRYVTFHSFASNFVNLGDAPSLGQIFIRDRQTNTTILASRAMGDQFPNGSCHKISDISADGRFTVFSSRASNLTQGNDVLGTEDIFIYDMLNNTVSAVTTNTDQELFYNTNEVVISGNGQFVVFLSDRPNLVLNDTNNIPDLFIFNRVTTTFGRVNLDSNGNQMLDDGGYNSISQPSISSDGRIVTFTSNALNLVPGVGDGFVHVFLKDLQTGLVQVKDVRTGGELGNSSGAYSHISADGRFITFNSYANNLVFGDNNLSPDIFLHDRITSETIRINLKVDSSESIGFSFLPRLSPDGNFVSFLSYSNDLLPQDPSPDIFIDVYLARVGISLFDDCPNDPLKLEPGICGCGIADVDNDLDSILDCQEQCPLDANKFTPGICGCGVPDSESDGDGILNCLEFCPGDSEKLVPGFCGCGSPEIDANQDGAIDCGIPPIPLTPTTQLIFAPLIENITKKSVTVVMQEFSSAEKASLARLEHLIQAAKQRGNGKPRNRNLPLVIKYEAVLAPSNSTRKKDIKTKISKRNTVTFKNLPAGNYATQYRVVAFQGEKRVFGTNFSPSASFDIGG